MASELASFFTTIGFKVDSAAIDALQSKVQGISATLRSAAGAEMQLARKTRDVKKQIFADQSAHIAAFHRNETMQLTRQKAAQEARAAFEKRISQKRQVEMFQRSTGDQNAHVAAFHKAEAAQQRLGAKMAMDAERALHAEKMRDARKLQAMYTQSVYKAERQAYAQKFAMQRQDLALWKQRNVQPPQRPGMLSRMGMGTLGAIGLGGGLVGAGYALWEGGRSIIDAQISFDKLRNAMLAVTGSTGAAASELQFFRSEALRLGQNLETGSEGFLKISAAASGSKVSQAQVRQLYTAQSKLSTVYGMTPADTSATYTALSQIISKGVVMSEELKGQLAERVYGVVGKIANEKGIGTVQLFAMMKKGEYAANDFIADYTRMAERMASTGGAFETALQTPAVKMNELSNAWYLLKLELSGEGGNSVILGAMSALTEGFKKARYALAKLDDLVRAAEGKASVTSTEAKTSRLSRVELYLTAGLKGVTESFGAGVYDLTGSNMFGGAEPGTAVPLFMKTWNAEANAEREAAINRLQIAYNKSASENFFTKPTTPVLPSAPLTVNIQNGDLNEKTLMQIQGLVDNYLNNVVISSASHNLAGGAGK